jgi:hypothetical protein
MFSSAIADEVPDGFDLTHYKDSKPDGSLDIPETPFSTELTCFLSMMLMPSDVLHKHQMKGKVPKWPLTDPNLTRSVLSVLESACEDTLSRYVNSLPEGYQALLGQQQQKRDELRRERAQSSDAELWADTDTRNLERLKLEKNCQALEVVIGEMEVLTLARDFAASESKALEESGKSGTGIKRAAEETVVETNGKRRHA